MKTDKATCKGEVLTGRGYAWEDLVPCARNRMDGSEYCAGHDPDRVDARRKAAFEKKFGGKPLKIVDGAWHFDGEDIMQGDVEIAMINKHHFDAASNARLIAAAPDLLAALKAILPEFVQSACTESDGCDGDKHHPSCYAADDGVAGKARAAIAKAEGGK